MTTVQIGDLSGPRVSFEVEIGGHRHDIWFESSDLDLALSAEAITAAILLTAMRHGHSVSIPLSVSAEFRANVDRLQQIWSMWDPRLRQVEIAYGETPAPSLADAGRSTGCFFSGGVDSFLAIQRRLAEVDTLVHVHGFDIRAHEVDAAAATQRQMAGVADLIGRPMVSLATNVRTVAEQAGLAWGTHGHGSAMWATAHVLAPSHARMLGASSAGYADLTPWGSHPLTCPLWSSDRMTCVHTDADLSRSEKVAAIGDWPVAMEHLRVCWQNTEAYNCGICNKCVRTMLSLEVNGLSGRCRTLPRFDVDLHRSALAPKSWGDGNYLEDIHRAALEQGRSDIAQLILDLYAETDLAALRIPWHGWLKLANENGGLRSSLMPAGASGAGEAPQRWDRLRRLFARR